MMLWFTARGAGLSALVLLSLATALGAYVSVPSRSLTGRAVLQYVHRAAGALGLGVLALHVITIVADSFAHVGVTGAIVPFTAGYRATWVGLGTIAGYLLLLVAALGFARGRLATTPRAAATWRAFHATGYLAWGLGMVHGIFSGTDTGTGWVTALYVGSAVAVLGALAYRLAARPAAPTGPAPARSRIPVGATR